MKLFVEPERQGVHSDVRNSLVDMWHHSFLVAEWIHLKTFWDNITHYKTKSVHLLGLMNPATKVLLPLGVGLRGLGVPDSRSKP